MLYLPSARFFCLFLIRVSGSWCNACKRFPSTLWPWALIVKVVPLSCLTNLRNLSRTSTKCLETFSYIPVISSWTHSAPQWNGHISRSEHLSSAAAFPVLVFYFDLSVLSLPVSVFKSSSDVFLVVVKLIVCVSELIALVKNSSSRNSGGLRFLRFLLLWPKIGFGAVAHGLLVLEYPPKKPRRIAWCCWFRFDRFKSCCQFALFLMR